MLDTPTLVIIFVILQFLSIALIYLAWKMNPDLKGIVYIFLTYLLYPVGSLFVIVRQSFSGPFFILMPNALVLLSGYFMYLGLSAYLEKRKKKHTVFIFYFAVIIALLLWYIIKVPDFSSRVVIFSLGSGFIHIWIFVLIARHAPKGHNALVLLAVSNLIHGVYLVILRAGGNFIGRWEYSFSSGAALSTQLFYVEAIIMTLVTAYGFMLLIAEDRIKALKKLSEFDFLTHVFNRLAFVTLFEKALGHQRRYPLPLSVIMCDLDYFKKINDTHGHEGGDKALIQFTRAAEKILRQGDILGRVGGEEFAVYLPHTKLEDAKIVAERLRARTEKLIVQHKGRSFSFTGSFGVTEVKPGELSDEVLFRADKALFQAKKEGRNKVVMLPHS